MMTALGQRSDSLWIKRDDALKVLEAAHKSKVYEAQLTQYRKDIDTLNRGISLLRSLVDSLKSQKSDYEGLVYTYERQIATMTEQRELYDSQVKNLSSLYKKERRKKKWATFLGIVTTGAALYLGTTF